MREFACEDCGNTTRRRRLSTDPRICVPCGVIRATDAAVQMSERSGPAYDAWQASNAAGATGNEERSA